MSVSTGLGAARAEEFKAWFRDNGGYLHENVQFIGTEGEESRFWLLNLTQFEP